MTFVPGPVAQSIFKKVSLVCAVGLLALVAVPRASAQGFNVIYQFSGNGTGANPAWSPTVDPYGNVYANAPAGGIAAPAKPQFDGLAVRLASAGAGTALRRGNGQRGKSTHFVWWEGFELSDHLGVGNHLVGRF